MSFTAVTLTTQDFFKGESGKIRVRFEDSRNGQAAVRERSDLVDKLTTQLWDSAIENAEELEKVCVVALGGYGRQTLFPCSDVDRHRNRSGSFARIFGICTSASARLREPWRIAANFIAITWNSIFRYSTADTSAGMREFLSN